LKKNCPGFSLLAAIKNNNKTDKLKKTEEKKIVVNNSTPKVTGISGKPWIAF
jgi:hypothetical protein